MIRTWLLGTVLAAAVVCQEQMARADGLNQPSELSALWWQWALSIPAAQNPQLDQNGGDCMVGQRGPLWFLSGPFGGGTVTRSCSIPADRVLFFPVLNSIEFNTPNVCGQGPQNISVPTLRQAAVQMLNGATDMAVQLDDASINNLLHIQSNVFDVALPESNVFDAPCAAARLGNVPAGVFSPAVDDGFYVLLGPLTIGSHTLHIHGKIPGSQGFVVDVTYKLKVIAVLNQ